MNDVTANTQQNPLLVIKSGEHYRYTVNPPSRKAGGALWDAGPAMDWCEVASLAELQIAALVVERLSGPIGGGRVTRQRACHRVTAICLRAVPHWPEVEPGNTADTAPSGGSDPMSDRYRPAD